ncbi:MAG: acyltransferase [Muribaculaceae bacterium]|nr:acyltransferase [Muribaculaceae bacterium]
MTTISNETEYTIPDEFKDIAPYDDAQFHEKMSSLVREPGFEHAVRYVMPDVDYAEFCRELLQVPTQDDFQRGVMGKFLEFLAARTTSGISFDGIENYDPSLCYTFITNHRDIVLDASFLNLCFIRRGMPVTQVAIGNNLLIYDWISDLVKLNRSFIVKRDVKVTAALEAARQLSAYIHYTITRRHESVWIAQREGRAKDSNDLTQESLIKMLALGGEGSVKERLMEVNLMPVAISYEFDPNDYLKAREFLLKQRDPHFHKSQRDDLFSMETGMLSPKGRVHFRLGPCINSRLAEFPSEERGPVVREACRIIDNAIHRGYHLYPCNYIAYDEYHNTSRFGAYYTETDVNSFDAYINSQLDKVDVVDVTDEERAYMRHMMLMMYANPVVNQLRANESR